MVRVSGIIKSALLKIWETHQCNPIKKNSSGPESHVVLSQAGKAATIISMATEALGRGQIHPITTNNEPIIRGMSATSTVLVSDISQINSNNTIMAGILNHAMR